MPRRALEPPSFPYFDYRRLTFSLGVDTDGGVYLSGQSASRLLPEDGRIGVTGNVVEQARLAYEKVAVVLAVSGMTPRDVVRMVDYVTVAGLEDYQAVAAMRAEIFGDPPPAITTVVVEALVRPGALIEIEAVASRRSHAGPLPGIATGAARWADGLLCIPAVIAPEADGIVAQTRSIYRQLDATLHAAGLGWKNVVKTVDFLAPAGLPEYRHTGAVRAAFMDGHYPAATGIIAPRLAHPAALIQIDAIAAIDDVAPINPGWQRHDRLTYVPAARAGRRLFISGQVAFDQEQQRPLHSRDIVAQSREIYAAIGAILAAVGAGPEAVVKTVDYVAPAGAAAYRDTAAVREEFFTRPYPAATGVICHQLLRPEYLLEVDALAVLD